MSSLLKLYEKLEIPKSIPSLEDSIKEIGRLVKEPSDLDEAELPGLDVLINAWYATTVDVDEGEFMRSIISGDIAAEDAAKTILSQEESVEPSMEATGATIPSNELHEKFSSVQDSVQDSESDDRVSIRVSSLFRIEITLWC